MWTIAWILIMNYIVINVTSTCCSLNEMDTNILIMDLPVVFVISI